MPALKRSFDVLLPIAFLLLVPLAAHAQFDTATVVGTVRDNSGAVVPGATVTLTNIETGMATTRVTDANGSYEFFTVRVGRYRVAAELHAFDRATPCAVRGSGKWTF